jgi:hypothetical protein
MNPRPASFSTFFRDMRGGILVETAVFLPFLVIVFFGVVELTQYIDVKERVNRVANQAANVFGGVNADSTGTGSIATDWNATQPVFVEMAAPHSINVNVTFCSQDPIFPAGATQVPLSTAFSGICGYGDRNIAAKAVPAATCPPPGGFRPGMNDVVVVAAGCTYSPMFTYLGLFQSGVAVTSGPIAVPLRPKTNS